MPAARLRQEREQMEAMRFTSPMTREPISEDFKPNLKVRELANAERGRRGMPTYAEHAAAARERAAYV